MDGRTYGRTYLLTDISPSNVIRSTFVLKRDVKLQLTIRSRRSRPKNTAATNLHCRGQ